MTGKQPINVIDDAAQRDALNALIATLDSSFWHFPKRIIALIPPQPSGYRRDRELFKVNTGLTFDPIAAAESSVEHTLDLLLHPQRLARLVEHSARDNKRMNLADLFDALFQRPKKTVARTPTYRLSKLLAGKIPLHHLLNLLVDKEISQQVAAHALLRIRKLEDDLSTRALGDVNQRAHNEYLREQLRTFRAIRLLLKTCRACYAGWGADWL